jgi:hypothetical protein
VHYSLIFAFRRVLELNHREKWLWLKCKILVVNQTAHIATTVLTTCHLLVGGTTSRNVLLHCALSFVVFLFSHSTAYVNDFLYISANTKREKTFRFSRRVIDN